jgi:Spy/CpxP family protein refolding chaperone
MKHTNKGDSHMRTTRITKTLITVSVILLVSGTVAFAQGGYGRGWDRNMVGYDCRMAGPGYGGGYGMGPGPRMRGYGMRNNLSEEDQAKLDQLRDAFFKETRDIRGKIDENRVALRNEMVKDNPDEAKVLKLQKQISSLEDDFDQKAIKHRLEVKKILPDDFQGRGFGMGRGHGRGHGYRW